MTNYSLQLPLGFEHIFSNSNSVNFYLKIFSQLDLSSINSFCSPKKVDRSKFSPKVLIRAFIVMKCQRFKYDL
jgi:hypothetical protein